MKSPKTDALAGSPAAEAKIVAQEAASAFGCLVQQYREHFGLTPEEARQRASDPHGPDREEWLRRTPADQVSWNDIGSVAHADPERAHDCWETVKAAALEELQSGHRAAKAVETTLSRCWDRAQFLAIRNDLAAEWQPRNGIERQLIDTMAQAQVSYLHWLAIHTDRTLLEAIDDGRAREALGQWATPRLKDAEAIEQAAGMVELFNRIFLRTLRTLQDLRRYSHQIIVQNAGQVNIAEKQVNVSPGPS